MICVSLVLEQRPSSKPTPLSTRTPWFKQFVEFIAEEGNTICTMGYRAASLQLAAEDLGL